MPTLIVVLLCPDLVLYALVGNYCFFCKLYSLQQFIPYHFILASQSPRRQQLLREAGLTFDVIVSHADESYPDDLPVAQIAELVARAKAHALRSQIADNTTIIIAADTTVCLGDVQYGKPYDEFDAIYTLRQLSGRRHQVITGVCLLSAWGQHCFSVTTDVAFRTLTPDQIQYYVDTYQPYDKAGAYAIQEWIGLVGIERIEGCYFNVVGLPVSQLLQELARFCASSPLGIPEC
jgi:septum formation protein